MKYQTGRKEETRTRKPISERGYKSKKSDIFGGPPRKKFCRFCLDKQNVMPDYKDVKRLERFITERGKITSRKSSGNCAKHQRKLAEAIKRSRFLALLP